MSNRSFKITNLSLRNKTTIFILTALLTLFGIFSYNSMPKSLYPDIVMPTIMVQTVYPGNSPADIENLITRPLEKEIKAVKGGLTLVFNTQESPLFATKFVDNEFNVTVLLFKCQ